MAEWIAEIELINDFFGKNNTVTSSANKCLEFLMFASLYNLDKLLKSASESISRVPMEQITSLSKYKKLPEHCKMEILSARLKRCDKKIFYKPGVAGENEKVSTMVQCDLLPTPEPPARPLSRSGSVSPQQPTNQNAANQPAANQNGANVQPANQNGVNPPQWNPLPMPRFPLPMGPRPAGNPFLRPPGLNNQQQPRGINPVH